jgi:bifunctional non-homologous end joining protein LigD
MPSRKDKTEALSEYRRKRDASQTPEPFGARPYSASAASPIFVVQQHRARHLHFDVRLELGGVLKSWAVPKGPSDNPADKRFAAFVEDHPLEYADFEGTIPDGNYGAGNVIIWDRGPYEALNNLTEGLEKGKLLFELRGHKLKGRWTLVRMKSVAEWLLIKERDNWARDPASEFPEDSILSGLAVAELDEPAKRERALKRSLARHKQPRPSSATAIKPMLATAGEAFDRKGWIFELKYDGYRAFARKDGEAVALISRNGHDLSERFPDIVSAVKRLPYTQLLIDGELAVLDTSGRPSFGLLQERAAERRQIDVSLAARRLPATYFAFDLLQALDVDLRALPLTTRKTTLQKVLPSAGPITYSEHVASEGRTTYDTARALGLEGMVGKRADSPYIAGRSQSWIKVRADKHGDFVIAGWTPSKSNRGDIGALALAEYRGGELTYVGRVGSGLNGTLREQLAGEFAKLAEAPALNDNKKFSWREPTLVAEVRFKEYTRDGHLRQPVLARLRTDKAPEECVGAYDDPTATGLEPVAPQEVEITNPDKVFFPEKGLTKGDLVSYYEAIAEWMLPYLKDRPIVLTRFPDGIHGKSFYQRDAPEFVPEWIERHVLWSESAEREVHYFVVQDTATLKYLANLGTIPIHTWHARITDLEHPDWCVLDLDPKTAPFKDVITAARAILALTEEIELPAFLKTSGASGLHVLIPLARQLTHDQARTLGELMARVIVARLPEITTITRSVRRRDDKVYIDYLQNGHGQLLVAPFSARAEPAASVSMPLKWSELKAATRNDRYHIKNAITRMRRLSDDPMRALLTTEPDLVRALSLLGQI